MPGLVNIFSVWLVLFTADIHKPIVQSDNKRYSTEILMLTKLIDRAQNNIPKGYKLILHID
jgi:hypothetical protein